MADGQDETPADETKKLTAKEQITELESRLRESNDQLQANKIPFDSATHLPRPRDYSAPARDA